VRPDAEENGHITLLSGSLGVWKGAGDWHRVKLLLKSRNSANLQTQFGFHPGNLGLTGLPRFFPMDLHMFRGP
jgi:hypothetical protein